jgi:hypothetical protein
VAKTAGNLLALAICALVSSRAHGAIITVANWTFPNRGTPVPPINATSSTDTAGTPTLGGNLFTPDAGQPNTSYLLGRLRFSGSTFLGFNNDTLTLTLTASANFTFTGLTYSTAASDSANNGVVTENWAYSINGGSSTELGSVNVIRTLQAQTLNFSQALTAGEQIVFTCTVSDSPLPVNAGRQTLDFSGITLTASTVPEPINYALAGFGLVFVAGSAGRFCLGRRRSTTTS